MELVLGIVMVLISLGIMIAGITLFDSWNLDLDGLGITLAVVGVACIIFSSAFTISVIGIEGNNRELFFR